MKKTDPSLMKIARPSTPSGCRSINGRHRASLTISALRGTSISPIKRARPPAASDSETRRLLEPTRDADGRRARRPPPPPAEQETIRGQDRDYPSNITMGIRLLALEIPLNRPIRGREDFARLPTQISFGAIDSLWVADYLRRLSPRRLARLIVISRWVMFGAALLLRQPRPIGILFALPLF